MIFPTWTKTPAANSVSVSSGRFYPKCFQIPPAHCWLLRFLFFLLSTHTRKLDWFSKLVDYCANFLDGSRSVSLTPFFPPFSSSNWSCRSISVGLLSGLSLLSAMELRNLWSVSFFLISFWFFNTSSLEICLVYRHSFYYCFGQFGWVFSHKDVLLIRFGERERARSM